MRVWDADSGACLEVIPGGSRDVAAISAEGKTSAPWHARRLDLETVIELASCSKPVAWFPIVLTHITMSSSGRTWAGSSVNYLSIIRLEGEPDLGPSEGSAL